MGDVAKIIQELGEPVERYVTKFRTIKLKYTTIMTERDCVRLIQNGLLWPLKKHFLGTSFTKLYHLLSEVARYERAKATKVLSKIQANKGTY